MTPCIKLPDSWHVPFVLSCDHRGLFIPAQIVNFTFVPSHLRFFFVGIVSLCWSEFSSCCFTSCVCGVSLPSPLASDVSSQFRPLDSPPISCRHIPKHGKRTASCYPGKTCQIGLELLAWTTRTHSGNGIDIRHHQTGQSYTNVQHEWDTFPLFFWYTFVLLLLCKTHLCRARVHRQSGPPIGGWKYSRSSYICVRFKLICHRCAWI